MNDSFVPAFSVSTFKNRQDIGANVRFSVSANTKPTKGWVNWGEYDQWPTESRKKIESSSIAFPAISHYVGMIYGNGLEYWSEEWQHGKRIKDFSPIQEVEEFFDANRIRENYVLEQMMEGKTYGNCYAELIPNKSRSKIVGLHHKEAEFCRLSQQTDQHSKPKYLGYSAHFADSRVSKSDIKRIRLYNNITPFDEFVRSGNLTNIAVHTKLPSPGRRFYGVPSHYALLQNDSWLDVANDVPKAIRSYNRNALSMLFHIKSPGAYWQNIDGYNKKSPEERKEIERKVFEQIDEQLTGIENGGKTIHTVKITDPVDSRITHEWDIEVISIGAKLDAHLPNCKEANEQILHALDLDPTLVGLSTGGNSLGSGGSDKRVGQTNAIANSHAFVQMVLEPLYHVRDFNGWKGRNGGNIKFGFSHSAPTTLDKNPTGFQNEM